MDKLDRYRQSIQESLLDGCALHVDIIDGKIWIQHDGTEDAIAEQLIEKGVPKQDIVLAYPAPHVRQYTEFGVG